MTQIVLCAFAVMLFDPDHGTGQERLAISCFTAPRFNIDEPLGRIHGTERQLQCRLLLESCSFTRYYHSSRSTTDTGRALSGGIIDEQALRLKAERAASGGQWVFGANTIDWLHSVVCVHSWRVHADSVWWVYQGDYSSPSRVIQPIVGSGEFLVIIHWQRSIESGRGLDVHLYINPGGFLALGGERVLSPYVDDLAANMCNIIQ